MNPLLLLLLLPNHLSLCAALYPHQWSQLTFVLLVLPRPSLRVATRGILLSSLSCSPIHCTTILLHHSLGIRCCCCCCSILYVPFAAAAHYPCVCVCDYLIRTLDVAATLSRLHGRCWQSLLAPQPPIPLGASTVILGSSTRHPSPPVSLRTTWWWWVTTTP